MISLNQNYVVIIVALVVLLFCYYLFRETKRTQGDVKSLQDFTGKMISHIEASARPQQAPVRQMVAKKEPVDDDEVDDTPEGNKED
tara:strand:- start:3097 stop:3354 length:258 start_codon:yes stop_codon:yes gene_type:complete